MDDVACIAITRNTMTAVMGINTQNLRRNIGAHTHQTTGQLVDNLKGLTF